MLFPLSFNKNIFFIKLNNVFNFCINRYLMQTLFELDENIKMTILMKCEKTDEWSKTIA